MDLERAQRRARRRMFARLSVGYRMIDEKEVPDIMAVIDSIEARKENITTTLALRGLAKSMKEINPALLEILGQINRKLDLLINEKEDIIKATERSFTYDISSESISLFCDILIGRVIFAVINLKPGFDQVYFIGRVFRRDAPNGKQISVIKFEYITKNSKQTLVYYMFSLERELIRQARK